MQFFNARMTASQMKAEYKKLALEWHPDINKSANALEMMKQINIQFAYWYSRAATEEVKQEKKTANPDKTEYYETRYDSFFAKSLEEMINWFFSQGLDRMEGFDANIVGVFIWIGGIKPEHREIRELIKSAGFQGAWKYHDDGTREYMWKWTPSIARFASEPNIDNIYRKYGKESFKKYGSSKPAQRKQLKG